jgi:hypothetical protein
VVSLRVNKNPLEAARVRETHMFRRMPAALSLAS